MRTPIAQIEPVLIMLESVATQGGLRFSGIDLEDGSRVTVSVERVFPDPSPARETHKPAPNLLLVLTIETLSPTH